MRELLPSTGTPSNSFAVTDHSELLHHVYKFESEKLLNDYIPVLLVPYILLYSNKMIFEKSQLFQWRFYRYRWAVAEVNLSTILKNLLTFSCAST
jgi:hypothetical protein